MFIEFFSKNELLQILCLVSVIILISVVIAYGYYKKAKNLKNENQVLKKQIEKNRGVL
jgi:hypothetical protein